MIEQLVFYVFSAVLIASSVMVVSSKSPVRGAFSLVLAFFASAVLWMLLEAEFLSLVLIFVYVGAVMTLFLFVVMMLNLDVEHLRKHFVRYLPIAIVVMVMLVGIMMYVIGPKHFGLAHFVAPVHHGSAYSNVQELGSVLYTQYAYPFELAAVLLLVAIVSAISLAFRGSRTSRTQDIAEQVAVKAEDRLEVVKMPSEKKINMGDNK